jgi:hypothetical protein
MEDSVKRKYAYYFLIVFFVLLSIINAIISFFEYNEIKEIKNHSFETKAKVVKEVQNVFGGQKSYKYLLRYNFKNDVFENFERGLHQQGFYEMNKEINIVVNKKNPNSFVIKDDVNKYINHLLISFSGLILLIVFIKFKSKII